MNLKRIFIATFASGLAMWAVAGIWHNLILAKFYKESTGAEHGGVLILLGAYIILGFFMSYLFSKLKKGKNIWFEGVVFGMIMGLVWVFPHELAMAGAHGDPLDYVFRNALWHIVEQAFGGIVIAAIIKE